MKNKTEGRSGLSVDEVKKEFGVCRGGYMVAWIERFESKHLDDTEDDMEYEPVTTAYRYGNFQLVGHGEVTNVMCGRFRSFWGCSRTELHDKVTLDGNNFKGKVYMRKVFHSCDKPSCPSCYKYGWAVREAGRIEMRLAEASKQLRLAVEHIVSTVPPRYYGLSYKALRAKMREVLRARGVIGSAMIFHGFRFNKRQFWYWSPHFHVLGFIEGGYKCRSCKRVKETGKCGLENSGCDGFVNRSYRAYEKDGCVVKVLGERKTVGGTAWYQLNHASIDVTKRRFQVTTWWGVCSYRKMKVKPELKKNVCPICQHDLKEHRYYGSSKRVMNCFASDANSCKMIDLVADKVEDGRVVWFERVDKGGY